MTEDKIQTADVDALLPTAFIAAKEAGKIILQVYESADFSIELKGDASPLTAADKAAHQIIKKILASTGLPMLSEEGKDIPYQERRQWPAYWLVDPLDGTKEFIKRNGEFTVNIALIQQGQPVAGVVYAPVPDLLYCASKEGGAYKWEEGQKTRLPLRKKKSFTDLQAQKGVVIVASRSHLNEETERFITGFANPVLTSMGSSLKLMLLAEGKADIYPRLAPTMEWDTAAAHAVLLAVGGNVFQQDLQTPLQYNKPHLLNPSFVAF